MAWGIVSTQLMNEVPETGCKTPHMGRVARTIARELGTFWLGTLEVLTLGVSAA
jgi:hypothetical protein